MDYDKLIDAVKLCGSTPKIDQCKQCAYWSDGDMGKCIPKMTGDAATALSMLQAENAQLRGELEYEKEHANAYHEECGQWEAENEKLRAELEQVKRECDEAVQCISGIAKSGRVWMCPYCVHAKDTTGGIAECELDVGVCMMPYSKFEWRGLHKEE